MKKLALIFLASTMLCYHCDPDDYIPPSSDYEPVSLSREVFEKSVTLAATRPIKESGKIYVKDGLLFINEVNEGFHVYDNSDPTKPTPTHFITAPGATDMAIRENMVFINHATDLIAVKYDQGAEEILVTKRIKNTFPELLAPDGSYPNGIPNDHIVIDWKEKDN